MNNAPFIEITRCDFNAFKCSKFEFHLHKSEIDFLMSSINIENENKNIDFNLWHFRPMIRIAIHFNAIECSKHEIKTLCFKSGILSSIIRIFAYSVKVLNFKFVHFMAFVPCN